jgi:hypothetical protein
MLYALFFLYLGILSLLPLLLLFRRAPSPLIPSLRPCGRDFLLFPLFLLVSLSPKELSLLSPFSPFLLLTTEKRKCDEEWFGGGEF